LVSQFLPISALLLGLSFLLFAGGINGLILPVRGAAEGFSALSLGALGTGWALGYISGCLMTARLVASVGHIRSFSVMCALAAVAILASLIFLSPYAWIPLRAVSGFCFAGAAMIAESWLSERANTNTRGRIFAIYTMISLTATMAGQMTLTLGNTNTFLFFAIGAMFYCLALVPTAISSSASPQPLVTVKLDVRSQWNNSPVAVFGVLMVGVSNSAFGTLAAVYGNRLGLALSTIALFASIPILAGALAQIPVGYLSDRVDRRRVLIGLALLAICADLGFIFLQPDDRFVNLLLSALFGGCVFSMYPVIVAHASDHAPPNSHIQTSGGLLFVYGLGAIAGPLIAGVGMYAGGPSGLFLTTICAHILLVGFGLWRIRERDTVSDEDKVQFQYAPLARASTPETAVFGSSGGEASQVHGQPDPE